MTPPTSGATTFGPRGAIFGPEPGPLPSFGVAPVAEMQPGTSPARRGLSPTSTVESDSSRAPHSCGRTKTGSWQPRRHARRSSYWIPHAELTAGSVIASLSSSCQERDRRLTVNQGAASIARRPRTRLCSPRSRSCRVRSSPRGPDGDAVKFIGERNQGSFLALTERLDELDDQPIPDCWPDIRHRRRRTRPIFCRRQPCAARRPPPAARAGPKTAAGPGRALRSATAGAPSGERASPSRGEYCGGRGGSDHGRWRQIEPSKCPKLALCRMVINWLISGGFTQTRPNGRTYPDLRKHTIWHALIPSLSLSQCGRLSPSSTPEPGSRRARNAHGTRRAGTAGTACVATG